MAAPTRASVNTESQSTPRREQERDDATASTEHQVPGAPNVDGVEDVDELGALYPPGQPPKNHRRGYIDDTLALPPQHLLHGTPSPEALSAARAKAVDRGLIPRAAPGVTGATPARPKRAAEAESPPKS
jgi:hypothetical protein